MAKLEKAYLAGGCFWCLDALYRQFKGIEKVVSGYAANAEQGEADHEVTYMEVSTGRSGYAETTEISFNPEVISFEKLLEIFWAIHDPTQKDRQGPDVGKQYRSAIFYVDEAQKETAERSLHEVAEELWDDPIQTTIEPLGDFMEAEEGHQDYYNKNKFTGYSIAIINPKLRKYTKQFKDLLK